MEKVECIKCGSVGYTASPEQVPCSECGGRHKVISPKYNYKVPKRKRILSLLGIEKGWSPIKPGRLNYSDPAQYRNFYR